MTIGKYAVIGLAALGLSACVHQKPRTANYSKADAAPVSLGAKYGFPSLNPDREILLKDCEFAIRDVDGMGYKVLEVYCKPAAGGVHLPMVECSADPHRNNGVASCTVNHDSVETIGLADAAGKPLRVSLP